MGAAPAAQRTGEGEAALPGATPTGPADGERSGFKPSPRAVHAERTAGESRVRLLNEVDADVCDVHDRLKLGHLLEWMDAASCLSAEKHCGRSAVTLVMDDFDFAAGSKGLLQRGEVCVLEGKVTRAFGSSMEVSVDVLVADVLGGSLRSLCQAYFMYVVLKTPEEKASKAKVTVPRICPETPVEILEHDLAEKRSAFRKQREARVKEIEQSFPSTPKSPHEDSLIPVASIHFTELVLPQHANHMGNTFGGQIMHWMAKGASAALWLHLRMRGGAAGLVQRMSSLEVRPCAIDQIHFKSPSHVGDRVQVHATVTRAFGKEMEIHVRVSSAEVEQQDNPTEVNEGFFTFSVCSKSGEPIGDLPDIMPHTAEQLEQYQRANARQVLREQRQETAPKPDQRDTSRTSKFSVAPESVRASLALNCVSIILRLRASQELHWQDMPAEDVEDVRLSVDFGVKELGTHTRLKMSGSIKCSPRKCFELLRDWERRAEWDDGFKRYRDRKDIGEDAELVEAVFAAGEAECDVQLLRGWKEHKSTGTFVIASRSVQVDDKPGSTRQRGEILPTGYIVSEAAGSGGSASDLIFIGQFDHATFELARQTVLGSFAKLRDLAETGGPDTEHCWRVDDSHKLGPDAESCKDETLLWLDRDQFASVSKAVEALNSGCLPCPAGLCVCYSNSSSLYFLLVRADREAEGAQMAKDKFSLDV